MIQNTKYKLYALMLITALTGCTKLDEGLNNTLSNQQTAGSLGGAGTGLLLNTAYTDVSTPLNDVEQLINLTCNTSDESLVATRAGDWDDNGKWRATHTHKWDADLVAALLVYNNLNKINFDATNVLAFGPNKTQAAEARFLRAYALYNLLDFYGQFPFRNAGDNLLEAPKVYAGAEATDFIINELTEILPDAPAPKDNINYRGTSDAVKFLLMRTYLNKGAFANKAAPTFSDDDMQKVITLGNEIISSGKYSFTANFFDNFGADNQTTTREGIWAYDNALGKTGTNMDMRAFWHRTLHYNSYKPKAPNAGWNGFSTVAEFYNTFAITGTTTQTLADSSLDKRIGGRFYLGVTDKSGLRPGLLVGQQFDTGGIKQHYRGWKTPADGGTDGPNDKLLIFNPVIAADLKENVPGLLEATGIRVLKFPPDLSNEGGADTYAGEKIAKNDFLLFRYADAVLMVAEAMMRKAAPDNAGALAMVNELRAARGAAPMPSMTLVSATNFDPLTLLAERGREMYYEYVRRTDLIRFGVFLKPWPYKPSDDPKYLLFPIPSQALGANPNLKQNPGY